MEEKLQEKYRVDIIQKYQARAWECLGNYDYFGKQYAMINKGIEENEARIKTFEDIIQKIGDGDQWHTHENKEKVKLCKRDIAEYKDRIRKVEGIAKKYWEQAVQWREDGGRLLEQVENFKIFKLKTLAQIEEKKNSATLEKK